MALQKQIVEIPIGQGLDEKTDAFLLRPGQLVRAENIVFQKNGRIQKRSGYQQESTKKSYKVLANGAAALQLESTTDASVLSLNSVHYSEQAYGDIKSVSRAMIDNPGIRGDKTWWSDSALMISSDVAQGIVTLGYDGSDVPKLDVTFTDVYTGKVDSTATLTVSGATSADSWHAVKCVRHWYNTNNLVIAACGTFGGTVQVKTFYATIGSSTITLIDTVNTQLYSALMPIFDLASFDNFALLMYKDASTATTLNTKIYDQAWAVGTAVTTTCASEPYAACLYMPEQNTGYARSATEVTYAQLAWIDSAGVKRRGMGVSQSTTTGFASYLSTTTITTSVTAGNLSSTGPNPMVGVGSLTEYGTHNSLFITKPSDSTVRVLSFAYDNPTVSTGSAVIYGHSVVSKPYALVESNAAATQGEFVLTQPVWASGSTPRHYSLFRYNLSSTVSERARMAYGTALGTIYASYNGLPVTNLHGYSSSLTNSLSSVCYLVNDAPSNGALNVTHIPPSGAAHIVRFDNDRIGRFSSTEANGSLLFTGGNSPAFDGALVSPNGLLYPPEIVSASSTTGSGNLVSGESYGFVAVLEYTDSKGKFHQSAPSAATTLAASTTKCELSLRMVPQSLPVDTNIAIYRTAGNGSTYYRADYVRVVENTVTYTVNSNALNAASSSIAGNNVLYTQTGEAENLQLGSTIAIAGDSLRVYAVSGDDPYALRISKPLEQWRGVAFFDGVDRRVPSAYGPITGLARIDGKTYVATEKAVFVAVGDGPDINGANDTLSELSLLSGSFGANDQESIIACDIGVMVFGKKGFWLIGRDGAPSYIGAALEDSVTVSSRCYGMAYVADSDELHCAMGSLGVFTYSAQGSQWSKKPNVAAYSIASLPMAVGGASGEHYITTDPDNSSWVDGVFCGGTNRAGSRAYSDSQDVTSADNLYTMAVGLGWIHLAGTQGLQRVYEGLVLGRAKATCSIKVSLSYDYVDTVVDTFTITSANATADSSNLQFRFMPSRQRCEAIKILIEDVVDTGSQAFELVGLSLVVGVIPGVFKLSTTKAAT